MRSNTRRADKFTKSKLFGSFQRVLYMQQNKNGILFSYICMFLQKEREREESSRWRKAGHRIAHILSALCRRLNCFRLRCSCNIPEMNQRSSRFRPCPSDFELSHTRICTCVCMSVYIIVFSTANVNTRRVYRGPCGASLFSV